MAEVKATGRRRGTRHPRAQGHGSKVYTKLSDSPNRSLFPTKSTSTLNFLFQPPLRHLRAPALIASRAFSFVVVNLFVDQHFHVFFCEWPKNDQLFASPIRGMRQLRDVRHDVRDRRDAPSVYPGFTLRKLRGGPSRAVVPDMRGGCVSELHGCNPWREDSATPHRGSCQRRVEDP